MKKIVLFGSHVLIFLIGIAAGIYLLPILSAPESPSESVVTEGLENALFSTHFERDLEDSDFLHWGEGDVFIHADRVVLQGKLAPGPDYRLYFSKTWVETEQDFLRLKGTMVEAGDVKTFDNFMVSLPPGLKPAEFTTVVVWCESFKQFITAAKYQ